MLNASLIRKHSHPMVTGMKALGVVAVAWGAVYPALLWGLGSMLP